MMRIALLADTFPPIRTSGAVQIRDLSRELVRQGHEVTVFVPDSSIARWSIDIADGVRIVRLFTPKVKDVSYFRRSISEMIMPFFMLWHLRGSPVSRIQWDGVIWYSPSIFLTPVVRWLKGRSRCRSYLIVRDIFPDWAVDMGLMRRSIPFYFFKFIQRRQFDAASTIGVQAEGNLALVRAEMRRANAASLEVLQNWLCRADSRRCSIDLSKTRLTGRSIFVYAGNMGVAQGMRTIMEAAALLQHRTDIGFVFVGRGTEAPYVRATAAVLANAMFFDEVDPEEIPGLFSQCSVGIVALDPRHKTHNIPGKFLTYIRSGLPVLANINPGNELAELIKKNRLGEACVENSPERLAQLAESLVDQCNTDLEIKERCRLTFEEMFSAEAAAAQIVRNLAG